MQVAAIDRQVKAADLSVEKLAANPNVSEKDKLGEVSRQFEAILLRQILTEAQNTHLCKDEESNSTANQIYKDMVTENMADAISRSGAVGLSSVLEAQLNRQVLHNPSVGGAGNNGKDAS